MEKIFEPFQSKFEGGTGLGLAIVYQIVQAHEGKVWARSKFGEGSEFVLRLRRTAVAESVTTLKPVEIFVTAASETADNVAAAAGVGGRALWVTFWCVMMSVSICEMLDIALRRDGHKVETAIEGEGELVPAWLSCVLLW